MLKIIHINKDQQKFEEDVKRLVKKWKQKEKEQAQKEYFKQKGKQSA